MCRCTLCRSPDARRASRTSFTTPPRPRRVMIAKSSVLISRTMARTSVPGRRRSTIDRSGHGRCVVATKRQATIWRRPPGTPSTTSTTLHGVYVVVQGMPDKLMASLRSSPARRSASGRCRLHARRSTPGRPVTGQPQHPRTYGRSLRLAAMPAHQFVSRADQHQRRREPDTSPTKAASSDIAPAAINGPTTIAAKTT